MSQQNNGRPPRTLLEQLIRERNQTLEEFTEYAVTFAREHGEPGTLSLRHLQRLIAGHGTAGRPLGPMRPATTRLLERIFGEPIDRLLAVPPDHAGTEDQAAELRAHITSTRRVDSSLIALLHQQLNVIRRIDRQLGAVVAHDEVKTKIYQVEQLLTYSLTPSTRQMLAKLLSELGTLAGWQALDLGNISDAWQHYRDAQMAAVESGSPMYEAHAIAEQAFVLLDVGEQQAAVDLTSMAREHIRDGASELLRAWFEAAHGETLAASNQHDDSMRAFDTAARLLATAQGGADQPYVALDAVHLARWRGHALARMRDSGSRYVLEAAHAELDSTYSRAEAGLYVDLAIACEADGDVEKAKSYLQLAERRSTEISSRRQLHRIQLVKTRLTPNPRVSR